ncbi:MAG: hypothetical protein BM555_02500 [Crocinitomix sp. MedPE-SWsnd]|jgi:hypothetical protein|nr:MAG: hypothetical protein BM555_02500 [Crocinitomix sp. MedPE-SWsnd]
MKIALPFLIIICLISCEEPMTFDKDKVEKIVYRFQDSSVPPQYHRSYEITISPTKINTVVDSYGDVLAQEELECSAESFAALIETCNNSKLAICENDDPPCTGQTSETLDIYQGELHYESYLNQCQGNDYKSSCGDVKSVIKKIKGMVPNLSSLCD